MIISDKERTEKKGTPWLEKRSSQKPEFSYMTRRQVGFISSFLLSFYSIPFCFQLRISYRQQRFPSNDGDVHCNRTPTNEDWCCNIHKWTGTMTIIRWSTVVTAFWRTMFCENLHRQADLLSRCYVPRPLSTIYIHFCSAVSLLHARFVLFRSHSTRPISVHFCTPLDSSNGFIIIVEQGILQSVYLFFVFPY